MNARGVAAVAGARLKGLVRSPLLAVMLAADAVLLALLPSVEAPAFERVRQTAAWSISAAGVLLGSAALLIPVLAAAPGARRRDGAVLGRRGANIGHAAAHLAFLVFLGCLFTLVSWIGIRGRFGDPDAKTGEAVVRTVVYRNPAPVVVSDAAGWSARDLALPPHGGTIGIDFDPRLRLRTAHLPESRPDSAPAPASRRWLDLWWRFDGGRVATRRVSLDRSRTVRETIDAPAAAGLLTVGLRVSGPDIEVGLAPGSFCVVGARTGLFAGLARALLVVACLASVAAVLVQWFSNFVNPLIAVSAVLTAALAFGVLGAIGAWDARLVAAVAPGDPASAVLRGHGTAWPDVLRAFLVAAVAAGAGGAGTVVLPAARGR